jgi:cyclic pyranopterin monophosphate synthase
MVKLSHLDSRGRARMVDVGSKPITSRRAVASALVVLHRETLDRLWNGTLEKGDALAVARVAGIQGAKHTSSLIPLCHPLPLDRVAIELRLLPDRSAIRVFLEARTRAATGVEMEALTGAAVAALTLIDMVKGVDRTARIAEVQLELKEGGVSGRWTRDGHEDPWRAERVGRVEHTERAGRVEHTERVARVAHTERTLQAARAEHADRADHPTARKKRGRPKRGRA